MSRILAIDTLCKQMDILTTTDRDSQEYVSMLIKETELMYPGINDAFYYQRANNPKFARFLETVTQGEQNGYLISTCRDDPLMCGKCRLRSKWYKYRQLEANGV